jgi:GntR family transcriptional regulator
MPRTPLYKAAETEMIARIERGAWEVGQRLPNEFVLADEFGVSQGTMRRALMTLEGMGLLSRKPGRGTIVAAPAPAAPADLAPAIGGGSGGLVTPEGEVPEFEVYRARAATRKAEPEEAALFGAVRLSVLERVLKLGGQRAALEEIALPEALVPALDEAAPVDLHACLEAHGVAVERIEDSLRAGVTTMGQSVTLSCDRHTGLLTLVRVARDKTGRPVARQVLHIADPDLEYRPGA